MSLLRKAIRTLQALSRSPILWGITGSVAFLLPIESGAIQSGFFKRYFAGHPVQYAETVLFFIGLAFLVLRAFEVGSQLQGLGEGLGRLLPPGKYEASDCRELLTELRRLPGRRQEEYVVRRLRDAFQYVARRGAAPGLDEHLKYLADQDSARMHAEYGLMRLVIWAIPILGFLGTVIGITIAIANLAPDALEKSLPEVTSGLGVAFDTTALALGLSIVLMFIQHYVERAEHRLLAEVDRRVEGELMGRFEPLPDRPENHALPLKRLAEQVAQSAEMLVKRQAALWEGSIEAANERWATLATSAAEHLESMLTASLGEALQRHARELAAAEQAAAEENRRHWGELQQTLAQVAQAMHAVQEKLAEKAEVLTRAVDATDQVVRLEQALNRNLAALAGAKNFEQTVMSLAAAIHLLSARLGPVGVDAPAVQLETRRRPGQAA